MLQSSLLETLLLLRPGELERFQKFVLSPYFNDGPYSRDTADLLAWLLPYAPAFDAEVLSIERAYASIYPGKDFVKGKIEVVMSKLHQLLKQFAAQNATDVFEIPEALRLATFFLDRSAPLRAAPLLEKLQEVQVKQPVHDMNYWMQRFLIQMQVHRLNSLHQNNHDRESLAEAIRSLHHAYLVQSLFLLNDLFFSGRRSKVNDTFGELLAKGIPAAIQIADIDNEPLVRLLGKGFEFARQPEKNDREAFDDFLRDLETHRQELPFEVVMRLYGYARNYCTWHSNRGDTSCLPILFSIFQYSLGEGLLYEEGKIPAATFLNMIQTGLVTGEFDWVKNALEQCRERISGVPDPFGFYQYNLANYHYHLQEYHHALDLIPKSSDGLFNGLMLRKLELKIYFETDSMLLTSKIDNFKLFIFRQGKKNLAENVYVMNNTFIDMLRSMAAPGMAGNTKRVQKLQQKLAETPLIAERKWLEGQLEKMMKQ